MAVLPHESMQQLIWCHGPEKMKYDVVATALQSIPAVQEDEQTLNLASESHNHGKHGRAPPCHINHAKKHTMTSFLVGQLSWVVSLAQEPGGWEHNRFIVERPSVRFEYKVPLLDACVFLDPISVSWALGPLKLISPMSCHA